MEITTIHLDMVQSVALAIVSYYIGMWIKSHSAALQRFSIPAPVIGGLPFALVFSLLKIYGIADFTFDDTLQKVALLCFFTTIGMMASLKLVKKGGLLLVGFWFTSTILGILQNAIGMGVCSLMGIDKFYGILAGAVALMGGLGTSAAFGPFFEQNYGVTGATTVAITAATFSLTRSGQAMSNAGATTVAITAATFGMATALIIGGPFGEKLIKKYKLKTPKAAKEDAPLEEIDETETTVTGENLIPAPAAAAEILKALGFVAIAMGLGSILSTYLGQFITLPVYIGSMLIAAVIRNIGDFSKAYKIEGVGMDCIADISLVLYVTMAINSLKLYELINLALPLIVILIIQTLLMVAFAWGVYFLMFGKDYDSVMLAVGGIGFAMGATANGLANMQSLSDKYGFSPKAWMIVSLVGAFLIDFTNAIIITWMITL